MKPAAFEYYRPSTIEEAVDILKGTEGEGGRVLAGGQSLVPAMNLRLMAPGHLVDISQVANLKDVQMVEGGLRLGALTNHSWIEDSTELREWCGLLPEVANHIGYRAIRNRGTIGGSMCHADPVAEWPLVGMLFDAKMDVYGPSGTRMISAQDFFISMYTTALAPAEILTGVQLSLPDGVWGWGFEQFARKQGEYALVSVGVVAQQENGYLTSLRIALSGVAYTPVRAWDAEQMLVGAAVDDKDALQNAVECVIKNVTLSDTAKASDEFRRQIVDTCLKRAVKSAIDAIEGR